MKRVMLMMVLAALLLTQCKKPSIEFPTPSVTTTVSMTITAGPGSKTDITTDGGIVWSENDKIYVGDGSEYVGYLTLVGDGGDATGTFTGDVTVATGGDCTFHFYYLGHDNGVAPADGAKEVTIDFSSQDIHADGRGNLTNASKHHVGYGKAEHVEVEADKPVTGLQVSMKSKVAIAYFSFTKVADGSDYTGALTLRGDNIYNKMTVYFNKNDFDFIGTKGDISLANTTTHLKYAMLVPTNSTAEEILNFGGGATGSTTLANGIEANKFYRIDGNMPIEVEMKPVEFTVDEYGTTVEFSKGNLQYLGKSDGSGTWRFADHQWDYMGAGPSATSNKGNVNLGSEYVGKYNTGSGVAGPDETEADKAAARDLFGWGATGFQDERTKLAENQINYQPYSTCKDYVTAGGINNYGYGPDYYETTEYGLTVADNSDWGCLAIGGDPAGTWRTLNYLEWRYLLNIDADEEIGRMDDNRFAKAKVKGVNGLLIFPDGYTLPEGYTTDDGGIGMAKVNKTLESDAPWPADNIPEDTWTSMETAGVVFLPAAGYRYGSSLQYVGSLGGYWSSNCVSCLNAYNMYFDSSSVNSWDNSYRYYGFAVRLVR